MEKVFVYGTLKQGHSNHSLLSTARLLGEYTTPPEYTMYSLSAFPAVSLKGCTPIVGEVYEVDTPTFERLDMLEGYPGFYDRTQIQTHFGPAWIYHIEDHTYQTVVETGEW